MVLNNFWFYTIFGEQKAICKHNHISDQVIRKYVNTIQINLIWITLILFTLKVI